MSPLSTPLPIPISLRAAEWRALREFAGTLPTPAGVVLDSNIWLDLLVFDDAATRPLRRALENGTLVAHNSAACRAELAHVLTYPQFVARQVDVAATLAQVDAYTMPSDTALALPGGAILPRCRDGDDQKFLELARDTAAHWLVSKDKALLKLRARVARDFAFRIVTPDIFAHVLRAAEQDHAVSA